MTQILKIQDMIDSLDVIDLRDNNWDFVREFSPYESKQISLSRHLAKFLIELSDRARKVLIDPLSITKVYHLIQWAESIFDVSSGISISWGAKIGKPHQTLYKRCPTAWSPVWIDGQNTQSAIIKFSKEVFICGVDVFENYNAGCVVCLSAYYQQQWYILWSTTETKKYFSSFRVFSPYFECSSFKTNIIRIDVDTSNYRYLPEIEAIRLRGRESYYWTPDTHIRYPMVFSQTLKCLLLCIKHFMIPMELKFLIIQYLAIGCEKWTEQKKEEEIF